MSDRGESFMNRGTHHRRTFLRGAALLPLGYALEAGLSKAQADPVAGTVERPFPGLITRQHSPENLEFPFPTLDRFLIPNNRFYVRSHFPVPTLALKSWRLRVEGAVQRPLELSYEDLRKLPSRTAPVLLECAGNGRVFLVPVASGVPWALGAVGTAEWTGIPLAALLDRAGVRDEAVEVILEGADSGEVRSPPTAYQSPGRIP